MAKEYRINKYIALCTGCSRRDAEEYVSKGLVKLNGNSLKDLTTVVKPSDKVKLKEKLLKLPAYKYYIFNKPAGYITTREDEKGRKTIYDLLPEKLHCLKPVGRLDKDSSGLILLTNDGDLMNLITHPRFDVPKKYKVNIAGKFTMVHAKAFKDGIDIGNGEIAHAYVDSFIKDKSGNTELILMLKQGYNRQIRRMVEKIGAKVVSLKRLTIATITLKNLKRSEFKELSKREVNNLYKYLECLEQRFG